MEGTDVVYLRVPFLFPDSAAFRASRFWLHVFPMQTVCCMKNCLAAPGPKLRFHCNSLTNTRHLPASHGVMPCSATALFRGLTADGSCMSVQFRMAKVLMLKELTVGSRSWYKLVSACGHVHTRMGLRYTTVLFMCAILLTRGCYTVQ